MYALFWRRIICLFLVFFLVKVFWQATHITDLVVLEWILGKRVLKWNLRLVRSKCNLGSPCRFFVNWALIVVMVFFHKRFFYWIFLNVLQGNCIQGCSLCLRFLQIDWQKKLRLLNFLLFDLNTLLLLSIFLWFKSFKLWGWNPLLSCRNLWLFNFFFKNLSRIFFVFVDTLWCNLKKHWSKLGLFKLLHRFYFLELFQLFAPKSAQHLI